MPERTIKERLWDLLNNSQVNSDDNDALYNLGDLIFDIGDLLAERVEKSEPYATTSAKLLREGGRSIQSHLRYLAEEEA